MNANELLNEAHSLKERIIQYRRYLHQNPETGFQLDNTKNYVKQELIKMGYEPIECGKAGLYALAGKKEGKTFLIRGDMDALPLKEETDLLEFKQSFVSLALESGAPIIPTYTDGLYGKKGPASVIIGEPINLHELYDNDLDEKENIEFLCNYVRDYIKGLGDKLHGIKEEKKQKSK